MTRMGVGGIPGRPRPKTTVKYVVDFRGEALKNLTHRGDVELVVTAASGRIERDVAYPVVDSDKWRATFDFTPDGPQPVDIRLYLRRNNDALSETWLFQHLPSLSFS